jgi:hypothetical protein
MELNILPITYPATSTPVTRPRLPVIFHVCRESRAEALAVYQPLDDGKSNDLESQEVTEENPQIPRKAFASPHPWPFNLYNPAIDTVYFPISLYQLKANENSIMYYGSEAAEAVGEKREFILDRLAHNIDGTGDEADVANIRSLAISWSDMHVQDSTELLTALEPFKSLQVLNLTFLEQREDKFELKMAGWKRGNVDVDLVEQEEVVVIGRFLARVLEVYTTLADKFNKEFQEVEKERERESGGGRKKWRAPKVQVRMARFLA